MNDTPAAAIPTPSAWRAWINMILVSWQRQARARLIVWIASGLMLFFALWVLLLNLSDAWDVREWRRGGLTYEQWTIFARWAPPEVLSHKPQAGLFRPPPRLSVQWGQQYQQYRATWKLPVEQRVAPPPITVTADPVQIAVASAFSMALENEKLRDSIAFVTFSRVILFNIFATFLLPLCSLSFATEALGREREQGNLLWTLSRPLPRAQIFMAKFVAVLPWCLALNVGGFVLVCLVAGTPGQLALAAYGPAIFLGTLAFTALFHLMGALFRRPAVIAILYSFFLETVMGNLPGDLKRASISFYVRSMMYESAGTHLLQPDRPLLYNAVSGSVAVTVLLSATVVLLAVGAWTFSRKEYVEGT